MGFIVGLFCFVLFGGGRGVCVLVLVCVSIAVVLIHFYIIQKSLAQSALAVILVSGVFYSSALQLSEQRRASACVLITSNPNAQQVTTKETTVFTLRNEIANHHPFRLAYCSV